MASKVARSPLFGGRCLRFLRQKQRLQVLHFPVTPHQLSMPLLYLDDHRHSLLWSQFGQNIRLPGTRRISLAGRVDVCLGAREVMRRMIERYSPDAWKRAVAKNQTERKKMR